MENEKPVPEPQMAATAPGRTPKQAAPLPPETKGSIEPPPVLVPPAAVTAPEPGERDGVFRHLVKEDADIAGLVAYSIYKQNKLDWLTAFEQAKARAPTADELAAYIIGEGTPRRLVTYRHLAEAMLAGNGPETGGQGARTDLKHRAGIAERGALTASLVATYALIVVLFLIGFMLAVHYTIGGR